MSTNNHDPTLGYTLLLVLYYLPAIVAFWRHVPSRWIMLVVNVIAGWTVVAWVILLYYAFERVERA